MPIHDSNISTIPLPTNNRFHNLTNRPFGRLIVVGLHCMKTKSQYCWLCRCECGNHTTVLRVNLRPGLMISCGCYKSEMITKRSLRHGDAPRGQYSVEYTAYTTAKQRCTNPHNEDYPRYGGRGIKFLFDSFPEFLTEVGRKPRQDLTLNRKNNNGHYEKGNLEWADDAAQTRNRASNIWIVIDDVTRILTDWCGISGIKRGTAANRIRVLHWCGPCAVTLSVGQVCSHRLSS